VNTERKFTTSLNTSKAPNNLEINSIYTRFFHYKKTLTDKELQTATEVDFGNTVALVVTIGEGENETIMAGARYVISDATPASKSAEVAFTVEEDYHGLGIASLLLRHLAGIARQKGISCFDAEVLPENHAMLSVFSKSGFGFRKELREGTVHVTLSIIGENS
jgi:ribosomal protein S18 acetylase RimI-like enzyme